MSLKVRAAQGTPWRMAFLAKNMLSEGPNRLAPKELAILLECTWMGRRRTDETRCRKQLGRGQGQGLQIYPQLSASPQRVTGRGECDFGLKLQISKFPLVSVHWRYDAEILSKHLKTISMLVEIKTIFLSFFMILFIF